MGCGAAAEGAQPREAATEVRIDGSVSFLLPACAGAGAAVGEGMRVTAAGLALGLAGALAAARLLRSQLYGVSATDVTIYAAVVALTAAVALVASAIPARRATRLDPVAARRGE